MASISNLFRASDALVEFRRNEFAKQQVSTRLSSGERISRSVEDVVDLNRSEGLRSEISAIRQVKRGNFDAVNSLQIADGTLAEAVNILTRIVELGTRSASDSLGPDNALAKQANDNEYQELIAQLDELNDTVDINGTPLFGTGLTTTVNLDVDVTGGADQLTITTTPFDAVTLALNGTDLLTTANADIVIANASVAIDSLGRQRGMLGAFEKRLIDNIDALDERMLALQDEESRIRDTDVARETIEMTMADLGIQSNIAVMAQANLTTESVFQLIG